MKDWKRPPPKFVRKKKGTEKIGIYTLIYIALVIIAIFCMIAIIKFFNVGPLIAILLFVSVIIVAAVGGLIIHIYLFKGLAERMENKY